MNPWCGRIRLFLAVLYVKRLFEGMEGLSRQAGKNYKYPLIPKQYRMENKGILGQILGYAKGDAEIKERTINRGCMIP